MQIMRDILLALKTRGLLISHLIRKANLSGYTAKKYIPLMLQKRYIRKDGNSYLITEQGEELLERLVSGTSETFSSKDSPESW